VLNSGALRSDTRLYQVLFNSSSWTGQLLAYEVGEDGKVDGLPLWDAATKIKAGDRKIATSEYTSNGGAGDAVAFAWGSLSAEQQAALGSETVVAYLRGDKTLEISNPNAAVGTYRDRLSLLGDIVNSAPAYLGPPVTMYPNFWQNTDINDNSDPPENAAPYSAFRETHKDRDDVIFVGANDGMLHAFDAETGNELFAYVPGYLVRYLKALTAANYVASHRYFVDGSPTVGDAFVDGAWRTVLVAGLGAGGQGLYALDVTDPTAANDDAVAGKVLWEFTDADDANLGYTIGQPNIVRAPIDGGTWVAMFGNGYSSTYADGAASNKGNAMLFAVHLEDRSEVVTWDTGVGKAADPLKTDRANGLGPVAPVDLNGDFTVDYAYAGDLFGNLWRFDFTTNKVTKLFTAQDAAKKPQAITTRPSVARHPLLGGVLVMFGTGKYFETGDNSAANQPTQTFYAIWDKDPADTKPVIPTAVRGNANTSELLQQKIVEEVDPIEGVAYRVTTDNPIEWKTDDGGKHYGWFIDLFNTEGGNTANFGERQASDSLVRQSKVIFTTLIPSADVCDFGGSGWLMELDVANGGRPSFAIFDVNRDGVFNVEDYVLAADAGDGKPGDVPPTGRKSAVGIVPTPAILSRAGGDKEYKYLPGSSGAIDDGGIVENPGERTDFARQTWQQHFAP
jgi:type IV pilus assembly protein PilY1